LKILHKNTSQLLILMTQCQDERPLGFVLSWFK